MSSGVDSSFNKCKVAPVSTMPFSRARRAQDVVRECLDHAMITSERGPVAAARGGPSAPAEVVEGFATGGAGGGGEVVAGVVVAGCADGGC
jgi:hypothetical protein